MDITLKNWKGKDKIEIQEVSRVDFYIVREHRKDKTSGEVSTIVHRIPKRNVNLLLDLIENHPTPGEIKARDLWTQLIIERKLEISVDAFNGGRNRSRYYFPLYYYPTKILEWLGAITYSGRGTISYNQE